MAKDDRKAATQARIMAASVALFGGRGYDGATVQAVADHAGVAPATVYWHFRNKANLYAEAALEAGERFLSDMRDDRAEPFTALAERWIAGMRDPTATAQLLRGLSGHLGNEAVAQAAGRVNAQFVDYWRGWFRERAGGDCHGPRTAERLPAALVVALLTGLVVTTGEDGAALLKDLSHLADFVGEGGASGIGPPSGAPNHSPGASRV